MMMTAVPLLASLDGRAVLITGASRGIGRACARACLQAGAQVFLCSRDPQRLAAVVREFSAEWPGRVAGQAGDISIPDDAERVVSAVAERWPNFSGLIHSAGVLGAIGPVAASDPAEWAEVVRVDLFGTYLITRAACRILRRGSRIVLLSGGGASSGFPNYSAYAVAKAGVVRLAETVAAEVAPAGIEVNALAPGFVATGIHEATLAAGGRAGEDYLRRTQEALRQGAVPAELPAAAAVFLVSNQSAGITGRLVSAVHDDWQEWPARIDALGGSDLFTLRRIVPRDRGESWQ